MAQRLLDTVAGAALRATLVAGLFVGCASIEGLSKYVAVDDSTGGGPGGDEGGTSTSGGTSGTLPDGAPAPPPPGACPDLPVPAVDFTANTNLSKDNTNGRACADGGDAVSYSVVAMTAETATLDRAPAQGCLNPCDSLLVMNLQGPAAHTTNVGVHETLHVRSIAGTVVTFATALTKSYGDGAADDQNLGTGATNQHVVLQRIPFYASVSVKQGATLTAKAWDGVGGGVLYLRSAGAIDVAGVVSMDHAGFRGGDTSGAGPEDYNGRTTVGGGRGGSGVATGAGGDGAGAPATGGGSGGTNGCGGASAAGGVGYIGGGGGAGDSVNCGGGSGGGGGAAYTVAAVHTPADFSRWYLGGGGSAGAGGGLANLTGGSQNGGDPGAAGGGIVYLEAAAITLGKGRHVSSEGGAGGKGADGASVASDAGGGGGGGGGQGASGGTILLSATTTVTALTPLSGVVEAAGGSGGTGGTGGSGGVTLGTGAGGAGGAGGGGAGGPGAAAPYGDGGGGGRGGSSGPAGVVRILQNGAPVPIK